MAIVMMLNGLSASGGAGSDCSFNGWLGDYLNTSPELTTAIHQAFREILAENPEIRVCVNLKTSISREAISNQIIRYKDAFKLPEGALVVPYLLYMKKEDEERALVVLPYSEYSWILAKGVYYCLTEPGSPFTACRNEIVTVTGEDPAEMKKAWDQIFTLKAGALQRSLDGDRFRSYDRLQENAMAFAKRQVEEAPAVLAALPDRTAQIHEYVLRWFLIKKVLYVQYMLNRSLLMSVHQGNVRRQRNQAKVNADAVPIVSWSEMWRTDGKKPEEPAADEQV